ncbi:MAG: phosphate signaling complex protein PhoU [Succinivibrionaceae bacterium]|nr:phosphate signaling complex protein PhoU [Succinivibrionaceae bacterium]
MRRVLDEQLDELRNGLAMMGCRCEDCISDDLQALRGHDRELAMQVSGRGYDIDKQARQIEGLCLDLLLRQQPVASDLRLVSAVLKMISDIERIGHQACDIAEIVTNFDFPHEGEDISLLCHMAEEARQMVHGCVGAFVDRDLGTAAAVIEHDDLVDKYFGAIKKTLITAARDAKDDREISLDVLMMAKYLERIGDHACNVAKWVRYAITGSDARE